MFGLDRSRRAGRYLEWKVRIFTVGAVLAMVGMYRDERWMTGLAIAVLLVGFVLRFLPGMQPEDEDPDETETASWDGGAEGVEAASGEDAPEARDDRPGEG